MLAFAGSFGSRWSGAFKPATRSADPQVFRRAALERVLFGADAWVLATATDDASLVERGGGVVEIVESTPENIKITTRIDLRLAELLLSEARV